MERAAKESIRSEMDVKDACDWVRALFEEVFDGGRPGSAVVLLLDLGGTNGPGKYFFLYVLSTAESS